MSLINFTIFEANGASATVKPPLRVNRRLFLVLIMLIVALPSSGCISIFNTDKPETAPTAEEMFEGAEKQFKDGDYVEAINTYEKLKSAHPEFEKIPLVHLRIGDALFKSKEYDKAAADYTRFVTLHPNDPNVPRARYMTATCHYMQRMSLDRDNTALRHAAMRFKEVMDQYKGTKYGDLAEEKYNECRKELAAKELYNARTYVNMKKYKAARIVARRILEEYGNLGYDDEAKEIIEDVKDR
jgi:outer membrane protein assembly factor BamD